MAFKNASKSEPQDLMTIFVETLTGTTFEIKVSPQDRVKSIKSKIHRVEGIPVSQQHLLFNSRELADSACVTEPGVALHDRATLKLVLSMRGGPISLVHQPMPLTRTLIRNLVKLNRESLADESPRMAVLVLRVGDQLNLLHVVEDEDPDSADNSFDDDSVNSDPAITEFGKSEENAITLEKVYELKEKMEELSLKRKNKKAGNQSTQSQPVEDEDEVFVLSSRKLPSLNAKVEGVALKSRSDFSKVPILPDIIPHPIQSTSRDFDLSVEEGAANVGEAIRPKTCPATLHESQFYDYYEDENFQNSLQITQPQFRSCVSACSSNHEWIGGKEAFLQSLQSLRLFPLPSIDQGSDVLNNRRKTSDKGRSEFEASIEQINVHHTRRNSIKLNSSMRVESRSDLSRKNNLVRNNFDLEDRSLGNSQASTSTASPDLCLAANAFKDWPESPARLNFREAAGTSESASGSLSRGLVSLSSKSVQAKLKSWTESPFWPVTDETKDYSKSNLLEPLESNKKEGEKKARLRCSQCRKKLSLANIFDCRCGLTFCSYHRYAETHQCTFDFKKESRKLLEQANPTVVTPKLPKI